MISAHPEAWEFQPENTIKLKPWKPSPSEAPDTTLLDLIPMLQVCLCWQAYCLVAFVFASAIGALMLSSLSCGVGSHI